MEWVLPALIASLALLKEGTVVSSELGCLDANGHVTDWYILYKIPKIRSIANQHIKSGEGYAYVDAGKWVLSDIGIGQPDSHLIKTVMQIKNNLKDTSYLMYNDEEPTTGRSGHRYGHTKGVLAVDKKSGFWIVHSIPRFPADPKTNSDPTYPKTAKRYGQSILCISFKNDMLKLILEDFAFTVPYIYANHKGKGIDELPEELQGIFTSADYYLEVKPPYTYQTNIKSLHGKKFRVFGKHTKWNKDLYEELVAKDLKAPLFVETWSRGAGGVLQSDCQDKYPVMNVRQIKIKTNLSSPIVFSSKSDHSKWAVSEHTKYVCIGDINRMASQKKRGGGTVCIENESAWKAFNSTLATVEDCPDKHQMQQQPSV